MAAAAAQIQMQIQIHPLGGEQVLHCAIPSSASKTDWTDRQRAKNQCTE